jgi:hypothetical protein
LPSGGGKPQFRLGELLLQAGAITRRQLSEALEHQKRTKGRLGSTLIEMGAVDERTIAHVLAEQLRIPSTTAVQLEGAAKSVVQLITRELAERFRAIPIRVDSSRLWIATADPTDQKALDAIERHTKLQVRPMVAPDVLIDFALDRHYGITRRAQVVEIRDAELLEVIEGPAVYEPLVGLPSASLDYLDDRKAPVQPPPLPVHKGIDGDGLRDRLLAAPTDDDIFNCLIETLAPVAGKLAVFLVRGGYLVAHRGRGIDDRALQVMQLKIAESPAMAKLLESTSPYLGPLPSQLGSMFQELGTPNGLGLPITLGKHPIGILIGGMTDPTILEQAAVLQRVATMVDLALHARHVRGRLAKA